MEFKVVLSKGNLKKLQQVLSPDLDMSDEYLDEMTISQAILNSCDKIAVQVTKIKG